MNGLSVAHVEESHTSFLRIYFDANPDHLKDLQAIIRQMRRDECFVVEASDAKKRFLLKGPKGWPRRRLSLRTLLVFAHTGEADAVMPLPSCKPNCVCVHHVQSVKTPGFNDQNRVVLGNLSRTIKAQPSA